MKARLLIAATLLVAAGAASAALNAYRTGISLTQAVKLGDGSILPAGAYDVEIHYKGFGGSAEMWFFQKGQLKGKTGAEARGFPTKDPAAVNGDSETVKLQPGNDKTVKLQPADGKVVKLAPAAFSWEKSGFRAGQKGVASPGSPGMLKLSFDSSHSPAGIIAILPYVEKGTK